MAAIAVFIKIFITFATAKLKDMQDNGYDITIREAQRLVDDWITSVGVRYFSPLTNMAILSEETGEVARIMARKFGDQSAKPGEALDLADELSDLLWVTIAIANQTGIDLTDALRRNLQKKNRRDSLRHKNNPKLSSPDQRYPDISPAKTEII